MSAVACLRVLVDDNRTEVPAEALGPLVAKYTNLFLEVRWTLPRSATPLSHYCYLLTDPRAEELDTGELAMLSQDLQSRLFGAGAEDGVQLALFEGEPEAIQAFSSMTGDAVAEAMRDPSRLPPGTRLRRIAEDGSLIDVPEKAPETANGRFQPPPSVGGAQGVYFARGQTFMGDVVTTTPLTAPTYHSVIDGEAHRAPEADVYDMACVTTALSFLIDFPGEAPLHLPVSFGTVMRPSQRHAYVDMLGVLPAFMRETLAATVYDTPRIPTFQAIGLVRATLGPFVGQIGLRVRDPDFEIQSLTDKAFASVTLDLPDAGLEVRMAALRRFASHMKDYRKRRIWPGVGNLRFRVERELALELGLPFLSGPGVCRMQSRPIGARRWAAGDLPLLSLPCVASPVLAVA